MAGVGVYAINLVRHLIQVAPHHEYVLFVSKESKRIVGDLSNPCLRVVTLPTPATIRSVRVLAEQGLLPLYVARHKVDLLHSLSFTTPLFVHCPSVVSILDLGFRHWSERFSKIAALTQNILVPVGARKVNHVITISQSSKNDIASELGVPLSRITVTYLAQDSNFFSLVQSNEGRLKYLVEAYNLSPPYILTVASSFIHKNLEGLIRAYALLVAEYGIQHQLVIAGHKRTAYSRLLDLINNLKLNNRVVFTGFVQDEDIPLLYSCANAFVFPSFYEGFGLPLLEAMACGVPIASSNATSLPEVGGGAVLYFDPYNVEQMAQAIYKILSDPDLRQDLVAKGLTRAHEFSWEKTARQTLEIYEHVARHKNTLKQGLDLGAFGS